MSLWIVGAGGMSREYSKVLTAMNVAFSVVGRGEASAAYFEDSAGIPVISGGVEAGITAVGCPSAAIVAVPVESLVQVARELVEAGVSRLLVEKPGALEIEEGQRLARDAANVGAQIWIAYNRRFYGSTLQAMRMIEEDGGILGLSFEFTEWSHEIETLPIRPQVKERWVYANSSHVLDLAFYLGGQPEIWSHWTEGHLSWHPSSARFAGAGVLQSGALFSYLADWEAPGRWGIEALTRRRRLILRPMEQLQIVPRGSVKIESVEPDDMLDLDFKPGLYRQTAAFLSDEPSCLLSLDQQVANMRVYADIAGY